jgi:hypothetical protein
MEETRRNLKEAATLIFEHGWVPIPLGNTEQGKPKRPMVKKWTDLVYEGLDLDAMPWDQAKGVGVVLGKQSQNLSIIDIDSVPLWEAVKESIGELGITLVQTVSNHGHIYVTETEAESRGSKESYLFNGIPASIDLLANGDQGVVPPTPGYERLTKDSDPHRVASIQVAWDFVRYCLEQDGHELTKVNGHSTPQGHPQPWLEHVPAGQRNDSTYIEAVMLRKAGMPLAMAMEHMAIRFERSHEDGKASLDEIMATVRSAYNTPHAIPILERNNDLDVLDLFR